MAIHTQTELPTRIRGWRRGSGWMAAPMMALCDAKIRPSKQWLSATVTPALHVSRPRHRGKRKQSTRQLAWAVRLAAGSSPPAAPGGRARVQIERRTAGNQLPDHDGLVGGCKGLIDCLLPFQEKRRKYGLGFVRDDSPEHMILDIVAAKVPVALIGMHITITPEPDQ